MENRCPQCDSIECQILQNEVDIGVGTMVNVYGAECKYCGQMSVCSVCGWWDFDGHANWCSDFKKDNDLVS
jgi:hypothetical protein